MSYEKNNNSVQVFNHLITAQCQNTLEIQFE